MLENGTPYQLAYGVRLTLGRVGRNPVIQVHPGARAARLQTLGVRYERGVVPVYYIPNSDEGQQVLRRILDEFPVETGQGSGEAGFAALDFLLFGAQLIRDGVVKFAEWSRRMLARFGEVVRRDSVRLYYQAKAVARNIFSDERGSIGGQEMGPHAPIFREFAARPKQVLEWLRQRPASATSVSVRGAQRGAGPTPPATDRSSIIGRKSDFPSTPEYHSAVARGAELLRAGVTHFADRSRRMLAEFGQAITPYLRRLYLEAKRLWRDTSGQSEIEIRALTSLAEHAQRLARGVRTEVGARARRSAVAGGQG